MSPKAHGSMVSPQHRQMDKFEEKLAHQERAIEDLSAIVARQDQELERLTKQLDALIERFLAVEAASRPDVPIDKPPHY